MKTFLISIVSLCVCGGIVLALDNGLGLTPAMGWVSWQRYRCNLDCSNEADQCISEWLYRRMADRLVEDGYRNAGYVYVNIDDCWSSHERHPVTKRLQPDPDRFPSGIPALARYMHKRGLKLGISADAGSKTCAGYPGSEDYFDIDAQTFADWGVDFLKLDGCYLDSYKMRAVFPLMTAALNKTGRRILFSCTWPVYTIKFDSQLDFVREKCNMWRIFDDVTDSWTSVTNIIDLYVINQWWIRPYEGPGGYHYADMIVIGNFGLSVDQAQTQMALWAIFASPLLMSNNLENIDPRQREILLNPYVIAVNQDRDGIMGHRHAVSGDLHIFTRPVRPYRNGIPSMAIAIMNRFDGGSPFRASFHFDLLGLNKSCDYYVTDLYDNNNVLDDKLEFAEEFDLFVNPSGVRFIKAICNQKHEVDFEDENDDYFKYEYI